MSCMALFFLSLQSLCIQAFSNSFNFKTSICNKGQNKDQTKRCKLEIVERECPTENNGALKGAINNKVLKIARR